MIQETRDATVPETGAVSRGIPLNTEDSEGFNWWGQGTGTSLLSVWARWVIFRDQPMAHGES